MGIAQPVLSEVEGLNPSYRAGQLAVAKGKTCSDLTLAFLTLAF
jgi:hypothetical protein